MDKPNVKTMTDEDLAALHKQASEEIEQRKPRIDLKTLVPGHMTAEQEEQLLAEICRVVRGL
jgi:hypothetical protein